MRVAVVAEQLLAPVPGGTGRYTAELLAALARMATPGDAVQGWVAWHRDTSAAAQDGIAPMRLPLPRPLLARAWARGLGPVPAGDLVHAPTPLAPPRRGRPVVVTVHDVVPWTHPQMLTRHGARWHRQMIERAARRADLLTVPTRAVAEQLSAVLPQLSLDRVRVLGAGVTRALAGEPTPQVAAQVRARLELPPRFVMTVATLEPRKGLDVLVSALGVLGPGAPTLVCVGQPGWGGLDLPGVAARAGLGTQDVRMVGRISDVELSVVLRAADALVAPSRAEGFGLPIIEAMAAGTPVICSNLPAFVEVAADAAVFVEAGDTAALAEAIRELLDNPSDRERLAAAGRLRSLAFDWDAVAERAWSCYRQVLG